ncbi:MAG TPA: hypothetical protein VK772_04515 [Puia sp.]|jgi:hypothetical protein|nr:hypothetical protein [Puia sp.]
MKHSHHGEASTHYEEAAKHHKNAHKANQEGEEEKEAMHAQSASCKSRRTG